MSKTLILSITVLMAASSSFATGSRTCSKTTKKCGTKIVKPLCGYGGQRDGQTRQHSRHRCGGCGGYIASK